MTEEKLKELGLMLVEFSKDNSGVHLCCSVHEQGVTTSPRVISVPARSCTNQYSFEIGGWDGNQTPTVFPVHEKTIWYSPQPVVSCLSIAAGGSK
jgi:hypothetical protein